MSYKPVDTAITMVIGPCIDDSDFKTLEEAIAYNAAGMDISLIVEKTDGTTAVTAITLTTGGTSDWTHKDGGYYEVEVTAAQNIEEGIAYLRGVCTGVLPFESPRYNVVVTNIYDSWIKGTDKLQTDVTQWLGSAAEPVIDVNLTHVHGVALTETVDGYLAAAFTKLFDVATPLLVSSTVMRGTDSAYTGTPPTAIQIRTEMDSNSVDLNSILEDTNELQINQGNWATAVGFSTHSAANVWSVATRILTANTNLNDLNASAIKSEVVDALADIKLDHLLNIAVDTNWATTVHLDSVIGHLADVGTSATYDRLQESLEAIRARGDAEWITASGFATQNPPSLVLADYMAPGFNTTTPPTVIAIREEMDANSTKMAPSQTLSDYKATGFSTHSAANVWSNVTRSLTDKSGFSLSTAGIKGIWDQLTSALTTVGSLGKLIVDNINATISSRSPSNEYDIEMAHIDVDVSSRNAIAPNIVIPDVAGTAATLHGVTDGKIDVMDAIVDAIKSKTDNLPSGISKNEALPKFDFLMVLSSDSITAATGKTITGEIMKDGGAFTAITNTITEVSSGMYTIASGFTQTEMNADIVTLKFDGSGCNTRIITLLTN